MAQRSESKEELPRDEAPEGEAAGLEAESLDAGAEGEPDQGELDTAGVESAPVSELDAAREAFSNLNDRFLRLAAEFDNFRKRTVRERAEWRERAQADFARQLLETLDDLGRVAALEAGNATVHDVIEGLHMVERKLLQELERTGFERVGTPGEPFDPNHHEAIATQPATDESPAGTVGTLVQVGYRLGNVLLRPARVIVMVETEDEAE